MIDLAKSQQISYQKWGSGDELAKKTAEPETRPTWQAPTPGCLKLNVDGSLGEGSTKGAVACVVRDSSGTLVDGFSKNIWAESSAQAETLAVLEALKFMKERDFCEAILETDSKSVISSLKHERETEVNARGAARMCRLLLQQMPRVGLAFCPRSANQVADWAARNQLLKSLPPNWQTFGVADWAL